ncbi:MAG: hypothetical protein ACRD1C_10150 [Terriglobales bacterium]
MAFILDLDPGEASNTTVWRAPAALRAAAVREVETEPAWVEAERRRYAVLMYSAVTRLA